ncbi:MAG TPA: hypothetical protein VEB03_01220 [Candidatus Nanoarchaeia archaeon]|nr:hypothetical protein [Candidatus Nanoarchaeia archaeon]
MQGISTTGLLATISRTGGLALLPRALPEGALVEISFRTRSGDVTSIAELLAPRQGLEGVLQPFRHIALSDQDHVNLVHGIDSLGN